VDFLEKPFDINIFWKRIEEAIKKDIANKEQLIEHRKIQNRLDHLTSAGTRSAIPDRQGAFQQRGKQEY